MKEYSLRDFHNQYIKGVKSGDLVFVEMHLVTLLTNEVLEALNLSYSRVHIKSITLKHIYEKRNAYEYDTIIDKLGDLVRFPDEIYQNDDAKKADCILVKVINEELFACLIKQNAHPEIGQEITVVVTAFKTTRSYLRKFKLIRSWKDGTPSS